jgi:hypothetical protein
VNEDDDRPGFRPCGPDVDESPAGLHERLGLALGDELIARRMVEDSGAQRHGFSRSN